jgi:FkbM family methyltransferase
VLSTDDGVGRPLYCEREFELDLSLRATTFLRNLKKLPAQGEGIVLDIGANMGVISIGMLHTGQLAKAIAIEPEPRNFSLLEHNVRQNKLEGRVTCLPYAILDRKGEVRFELSDTNSGDHRVRSSSFEATHRTDLYQESERRVISIEAATVDQLIASLPENVTKDIVLVWVDTQGYEGFVFSGARELLSKGVPVVAEIWPYGLERSGMSRERFCEIAETFWSSYWVWRRRKFVRYPISALNVFFDELGCEEYENVIFTE